MSIENDARFWDRTSRKYAKSEISDQAGYEHTLNRTRTLLKPHARVLELGCGTGTTALQLADAADSYLATDISAEMISIARDKLTTTPVPGLVFSPTTADMLEAQAGQFDAVLGFNYLHLLRDLPGTLRHIHSLLEAGGLFISKTPCVGEMNLLIRSVLLPLMRAVRKAPFVSVFRAAELNDLISAAGFDIVATEQHASKGRDIRPYIIARKT